MPRRPSSALAGSFLVLLVAGTLTACASTAGPGSPATPSSTPSGSSGGAGTEIEVDAAWLDNGRMIGIVTEGSSTCVPTAGEVALNGAVLDVELIEPPEDIVCTRDLAPRATIVAVPEGVDPTQELEIRVTLGDSHGDTDLDGVAGLDASGETDYLPSAGWTDDDGEFIVLTWGSSSCVPAVESVTTAGSEVTVTFVTPPADQVCTADMAPRGTLVQADGLDDDSEAFAILTGGEFDNVRIPIIGND
ncbi:hypothetical protein K0817_002195 [Microbacterium sp. HD4P20]|uniref:hypothetical protein n=1 Tax=Microbacterium sp. HD4P20 TaxID=2864874 RepID=UPI001C63D876|nr:hypothetical protein [Microbacterium sp. HD4P20]MCP2635374.1 hypothetical protein [Microbacterium sp. HD4P20]